MSSDDPFRLLRRALDQTGSVITDVRPDQAGLLTPCPDFDVHALVNHTVYDLKVFTAGVTEAARDEPGADLIGNDWPAAFNAASESLLAAWEKRGTGGMLKTRIGEFSPSWAVGQHLADVAVHAWDIASATGQSTDLDPEVGQAALDWARDNLKPEFRGKAFGPEVEAPAGAPLYARLAAFFGRTPPG